MSLCRIDFRVFLFFYWRDAVTNDIPNRIDVLMTVFWFVIIAMNGMLDHFSGHH